MPERRGLEACRAPGGELRRSRMVRVLTTQSDTEQSEGPGGGWRVAGPIFTLRQPKVRSRCSCADELEMTHANTSVPAWTADDVLGVMWVVMRYLASGSESDAVIRRRLHWSDHMLPCLQTPSVKGSGFGDVAGVGPLLALSSFIVNCQRHPDDRQWCRDILEGAQVSMSAIMDGIEPLACLFADSQDVPMQIFQPDPEAYALVTLSELPYGGSMHGCTFQPYFEEQRRKIGRVPRVMRLRGAPRDDQGERVEAGRRLTLAVMRGDLDERDCEQHQDFVAWDLVNAAAEHIRVTVRPWTREAVQVAARSAEHLTEVERDRLENLFVDPIRWNRGGREVVGGQHRLCGYRVAGVTHAFVSVGLPATWRAKR